MERKSPDSLNKVPTPGKLSAGQEPLLPAEVLNPTVAISGGQANISWTEPTDLSGKADYTHVDIYDQNQVKVAGPIAKGTAAATISGLTVGVSYTFKLVTVSSAGIESAGVSKAADSILSTAPSLLITEIMAAPKAAGEAFEYVELYNTTSQPIDLTNYQIQYYTQPGLAQPWTDANAKKWKIVAQDTMTEGTTNMTIAAHDTKIVWLVKPDHLTYKVNDFIKEYDSTLSADQFVYALLGAKEGLDNAVQRNVAIVRPGGDPVNDRISMAAYNVNAGTGSCAYVATQTTPACDYKRTATTQESIIYFFPAGGLDPVSKLMERKTPESLNKVPSPGKLSAGQEPLFPAEVLNPTAVLSGGKASIGWTEPTDLSGKDDYTHVDIYQNGIKAAGPIAKGTSSAVLSSLMDGAGYIFKLVTVSSTGIESAGVIKSIGGPIGSGITQEELGLRSTKIKVAAIGDSITRNTGTTTTYPQNLGIVLGPDYEVRNFGVSGTTLLKNGDSSYWNQAEFQQSKDWSPDIVVIMLGSNDSKPQNWQYKSQFVTDYTEIINQYKSLPSHPRVFVNLPPKVYGANKFSITDSVVKDEVIPAIRETAASTGTTVIDVYSATVNMPENFPDNVHPNDNGTKVIAKAVHEQLSKYYISYGEFNKIVRQGSVIPGLKQGVIPQGAAYMPGKNWMLHSYYREDGKASGITVTDLTTGKFVKALELYQTDTVPYKGHVGGIAVSQGHLWISSEAELFPVSLPDVIAAVDGGKLIISDWVQVETNGSFVTYADGILWVGEFARDNYPTDPTHHMPNRDGIENPAWVAGYKLNNNDLIQTGNSYGTGTAIPDYILSIPQEIQGMSVVDDKVVLSRSYGRNNDSTLFAYNFSLSSAPHSQTSKFGTAPVPIWFLDGASLINTLTMPPMSESVFERNGNLYVLFESGAQKYADGKYPIDKMQLLDAQSFLTTNPPTASLLITEIMAAPKVAGEPYEYVELYNTTDQPIDLTGYQIHYYTNPALQQPWLDPNAKKWGIEPMDGITEGATNMSIAAHGTKIVWLIKPQHSTYKVNQFIAEFDPSLKKEQFVYARLGANEGLDNSFQRNVAIVGPGGNAVTDRISMAAYNVNAGTGECKYVANSTTPACDFAKTATSQQSVIYFLPANGLDSSSKLMERRAPGSLNQAPSPGKRSKGQDFGNGAPVDPENPNPPLKPASLLITEIMAAPKGVGELYEYVELYNTTNQPIDLTGYKLNYYSNPKLQQPWTDTSAKEWSLVGMDDITGGKTDMYIQPYSTKVVWLVKDSGLSSSSLKVEQFIAEYDSSLSKDRIVYAKLGAKEGLENAVQRVVAIVAPGGDRSKDRISMAAYNVGAGTGECQYVPSTLPACDFVRTENQKQQSVNYFIPANGLDTDNKLMERRIPDSLNQSPTPGKLYPDQVPDFQAATGDQLVTLTWKTENLNVLGYRTYQDGIPLVASVTTVTYGTYSLTVGNLTNGRTYSFALTGVLKSVYGQAEGETPAMFPVLVTPYSYTGMFIEGLPLTTSVGKSFDAKVKLKYFGKQDDDITALSTFESSDPSVITITGSGHVTTIGQGQAEIKAVYGEKVSTLNVGVRSLSQGGGNMTETVPNIFVPPSIASTDSKHILDANTYTVTKAVNDQGQGVARIKVNETQLVEAFQALRDSDPYLALSYDGNEPVVEVIMSATAVQSAKQYNINSRFVIYQNGVSFDFPLTALKLETEAQQLGVTMDRINIHVTIAALSDQKLEEIRTSVSGNDASLLSGAYHFQVHMEIDGKMIEIKDFGKEMVTRTLIVYGIVNPDVLTGVLITPEGTVHFIPSTTKEEADGNTYVTMKNTHNSTYAVIQSKKSYDDIKGHWAERNVEQLASKQILNGIANGHFTPDTNITRAEFAALLVNATGMSGQPLSVEESSIFKDVNASEWYAKSVDIAAMKGLVLGYDEHLFKPNALVTREEMAVMILRALQVTGKADKLSEAQLQFNDKDQISVWARKAVAELAQAQIIEGMAENTFVPTDNATRAQAVTMAKRMLLLMNYLVN
ncbi:lamin tail domain-containing protein [Paenibacillus foliorum]|nr:lamin tail domain-containing protein [Paenibacillus foliorum]